MPPTEQESQGDRIARLRRALRWSQANLAMKVGVKPSQISKYERNAYEPRLDTLSRIAAVLGTSTDYLITGKEATSAQPDRLLALWPVLAQLPPGLRNGIADFLSSVLYAQALFERSGQGSLASRSETSVRVGELFE